jgi:hypothetical protein
MQAVETATLMTIEEALVIVDSILSPKRLSSVQELVFRNCWAGQTYQQIALDSGYDADCGKHWHRQQGQR